ncbi:hypothetical protein [Micromonospora sp. NPDC023888]|uniref:hypothetical protein n=1 Tax=Micromonospora sp. NPDC023888 TaxID=3155607 RepID=UPI0033E8E08E
MRKIRRTIIGAVVGFGLVAGVNPAPAVAAPAGREVAAAAGYDCYEWGQNMNFAPDAPWHIEPYGSSPVSFRGGGKVFITYYCINSYGNYWYMRSSGYFVSEKYHWA